MATYSIKDLEHLSSIKAHTLRIWEQRYNFLNPKRTDTNIRYYDDQDLKLILNVSLLKENGYKISKIAKMSSGAIQEEVLNLTQQNLRYPDKIQALTLAMIDLDEDKFEKLMANNVLQLGFESTMINVIYPFMTKVGLLWQAGTINPAHEHFISNLVRQKLIVAIDGQFIPKDSAAKKYLLFLPEGEYHEIPILFTSYLLRARGNNVVYLGQNLPLNDLKIVFDVHQPDYLFTFMTAFPVQSQLQGYIDRLSIQFKQSTILISGNQVVNNEITLPKNTFILDKVDDFIKLMEENKYRKAAF
ncbi:MAG: MerR family transcriptional regulator [Bacteroidota bacterium]|nr:MerR family transcriptional regulator [Bacteroidota bacterium]